MRKAAVVHGFGGYFECNLYDDVSISINPPTASEGMFSWFPCYFPLQVCPCEPPPPHRLARRAHLSLPSRPQTPVQVEEGDVFELQVWRIVGPRDVWYEWAVSSPRSTPIHNANGHAFKMGL